MTSAIQIAACIALYGIGQLLLKTGLGKLPPLSIGALDFRSAAAALMIPELIIGIICLVSGTLVYVWLLTRTPLTILFPLISLVFPLVMLLGWVFLGEPVSWRSCIGTALLMVALYLITTGQISAAPISR